MNQCDGRISARDAYIIENLRTWCGTAGCANTCMCLLTSFMEKTAFVWHCDQHQIRVSRMVSACVHDGYLGGSTSPVLTIKLFY